MESFHLTMRARDEGTRVIEVHGELDLAVAAQLADKIGAIPAPDHVVIDLAGCEFIDSTALATLLIARRDLAGAERELRLAGASGQVLRILQVAGLDHIGLLEGEEIEVS
ncbi:MAG TPA: STAS domain-containing protein [Solirubrobacterales bacterium]|nr:STAS domain-containing protein [Solirubrobacterales bacterium]